MFSFEGTDLVPQENGTSLDSSMVEHAAVNRGVAGSSPARGALRQQDKLLSFFIQFIRGISDTGRICNGGYKTVDIGLRF